MIKIENVSFSFPQKDLYDNVSFTLEENQHCAFIGTNGTGKSTLIEIIRNSEKYLFDGKIEIEKPCRIGYVSQFYKMDSGRDFTVSEYLSQEFAALQEKINNICKEMETAKELEPFMEQYQTALDLFGAMDGDYYESNIKKQLKLANLQTKENLAISKLSGGEFKLIQVIKEMLTRPSLMILDEPDVFLDFENLNGLKELINSYKGTILVITHNRYLLNHCFNKIIHLENAEIQEFSGSYMEYDFSLLQRKIELQELAVADLKEIERNKQVVDKLRNEATKHDCASRGRALHARVSLLERLEERRIKEPFVDIKQPQIQFYTDQTLEDSVVLELIDYGVQFDELLLEHVGFSMMANEKVAIVGPNGCGKTTLLREIYNNNHPAIKVSPEVRLAFLSKQPGETLNQSHTILEEFGEGAYLSQYGFEKELLHSKIESLSGGEKSLLQLAKIARSNANMLLLDEPTSDLDLYAQIALEKAIKEYNGSILMVSHDFYTIANCMDYVLLIEEKTIRKIRIRKFRQMIYENHFSKDYLEIETKKKEVETQIAFALQEMDYELAKKLCEQLEKIIKRLRA